MKNNYFLPAKSLVEIADIDPKLDFQNSYSQFKAIFFKYSPYTKVENSETIQQSILSGRIIVLSGKTSEVYSGSLWRNKKIDYVGLMDYLFTVPLWDWWINPLFPREEHRRKNESIILTDKMGNSEFEETCRIIESEGYLILDKINAKTSSARTEDIIRFKTMAQDILPRKLAFEICRLRQIIDLKNKYYFVMRGGKVIRDILDKELPESNVEYINQGDNLLMISPNSFIIDDCIGTGKTLERIIIRTRQKDVNFFALDSTLPLKEYTKKFPEVTFNLPESYLNIYCCRLFEENLGILGEAANFKIKDNENEVRMRLFNKIRKIMRLDPNYNYRQFEKKLINIKNFNI